MSRFIDLTGEKFGRLAVLSRAENKGGRIRWNCLCDCSKNTTVSANHLNNGTIRSCGCLRRETIHGMAGTPTYRAWADMKHRCCNENNKSYNRYGGRGIIVCERWLKFENFYADMGDKPDGLTIERVNNNKGYSLANCKWATWKEQNRNTVNIKTIKYNGQKKSLPEWAEEVGIKKSTLYYRLKHYPPQIAFNMCKTI